MKLVSSSETANAASSIIKLEALRRSLNQPCLFPVDKMLKYKNESNSRRFIVDDYLSYLYYKAASSKVQFATPTVKSCILNLKLRDLELNFNIDTTNSHLSFEYGDIQASNFNCIFNNLIRFFTDPQSRNETCFIAIPFLVHNFGEEILSLVTHKKINIPSRIGDLSPTQLQNLRLSYALFSKGHLLPFEGNNSGYAVGVWDIETNEQYETLNWAINQTHEVDDKAHLIIKSELNEGGFFVMTHHLSGDLKKSKAVHISNDAPSQLLEKLANSPALQAKVKIGNITNFHRAKSYYSRKGRISAIDNFRK